MELFQLVFFLFFHKVLFVANGTINSEIFKLVLFSHKFNKLKSESGQPVYTYVIQKKKKKIAALVHHKLFSLILLGLVPV